VNAGDQVGEAGNSGMSERPHLHMQLMKSETDEYWKGRGICICYEARNLYKNRIIKSLAKCLPGSPAILS
jgi:murein DD-endopeptidase MepM/ murein hydrolase activator NlpD